MKYLITIILLACSQFANSQPFPGYKTGSGFETATATTGFSGQEQGTSGRIITTTHRKRFGNRSVRFECRDNDPLVGGGQRTEIYLGGFVAPFDSTIRKSAFSFYIPSDSFQIGTREAIIQQYHTGSASPNLAIKVKNGILYADIRRPDNTSYPWIELTRNPFNAWRDVYIDYNPSSTNTGDVRIWIDDTLAVNFLDTANYPAPGGSVRYNGTVPAPWWKMGLYIWEWNATSTSSVAVIYMDSVIIGTGASNIANYDVTPPVSNNPPTVSATSPIQVAAGVTSTTLTATATDGDGTIVSRSWTQLSGPNTATITSPTSNSTTVTGLINGSYTFQFTATDDDGASSTVNVTVNVNAAPTVDLSGNVISYNYVNTVQLISSASDPDGSIASYQWTQRDGAPTTIQTPTASSTYVTGLTPGTFLYELQVTDNLGAIGVATVEITVTPVNIITIRKTSKLKQL